jgi:hypothetical protein
MVIVLNIASSNNITSKGNKSLGYLKRNLQISNPEVKSRAYQALVRPKLEYSCSIWNPYTVPLYYSVWKK